MNKLRVAEVLKNVRKSKNYSVMQVQQMLRDVWEINVSVKTIYSWEAGHSEPGISTFLALLDLYDIRNIGIFIGKDSFSEKDDLTEEDRYILERYHKNEPEYRRHRKAIQDILKVPRDLRSL